MAFLVSAPYFFIILRSSLFSLFERLKYINPCLTVSSPSHAGIYVLQPILIDAFSEKPQDGESKYADLPSNIFFTVSVSSEAYLASTFVGALNIKIHGRLTRLKLIFGMKILLQKQPIIKQIGSKTFPQITIILFFS